MNRKKMPQASSSDIKKWAKFHNKIGNSLKSIARHECSRAWSQSRPPIGAELRNAATNHRPATTATSILLHSQTCQDLLLIVCQHINTDRFTSNLNRDNLKCDEEYASNTKVYKCSW